MQRLQFSFRASSFGSSGLTNGGRQFPRQTGRARSHVHLSRPSGSASGQDLSALPLRAVTAVQGLVEQLLLHAYTRSGTRHSAPILTVIAFINWWEGRGSKAHQFLQIALEASPPTDWPGPASS